MSPDPGEAVYYVAELNCESFPRIGRIDHYANEKEAKERLIALVRENGSEETEENIFKEIGETAHFRDDKCSKWAVAFGKVRPPKSDKMLFPVGIIGAVIGIVVTLGMPWWVMLASGAFGVFLEAMAVLMCGYNPLRGYGSDHED